jgi:hypothetical protein
MRKSIKYSFIKFLLILFISRLLILNKKFFNNVTKFFCNHNYHKIKEIDPTIVIEGIITYKCIFCGNEINKVIPKLDIQNYFVENIKSNCEHGNGKKYISKENKKILYEITDNLKKEHSIYGSKCKFCNKTIGDFDFHKLSDFRCNGYPRLYRLSEYWNNRWLLGGDNGTILCYISDDEGLTWSSPSIVSNFPNYSCSNVDFFELPNHDIICSYRAIGLKSNDNPLIKYNRKIFSSISKNGGKTWKDLGLIVDNFLLAQKLGKSQNDTINAVIHESNIGFFEPFVQLFKLINLLIFYSKNRKIIL